MPGPTVLDPSHEVRTVLGSGRSEVPAGCTAWPVLVQVTDRRFGTVLRYEVGLFLADAECCGRDAPPLGDVERFGASQRCAAFDRFIEVVRPRGKACGGWRGMVRRVVGGGRGPRE